MASNILKFHPSNLITGINIVDDMLFFTDGVNEPKKIDLNIFRAADHSTGNTIVYGLNLLPFPPARIIALLMKF